MRPLTDSAARIARGLSALTVLVGVVAGVPWLLWHLVGWPLPDRVPTWAETQTLLARPMDDQFLLSMLACAAWAAWAGFTLETLAATVIAVADLRAHPTPGVILPGLDRRTRHGTPLGRVTAGLVSAVILTLAVARPTPTRLALTPAAAALAATTGIAPTPADRADAPRTYSPPSAPPRAAPTGWREYTVPAPHHGIHDSLWRIADRELGDPRRWTQIYRLNVGRPQHDGQHLHDPDLIYPGWILRLPTDRPAPPSRQTPPPQAPAGPPPPALHPPTTAPTRATPASPTPASSVAAHPSSARPTPTASGTGNRPPRPGPAVTTPASTPAAGAMSPTAPAIVPPAQTGSSGPGLAQPAGAPQAGGQDGLDLPSGGYVGLALAAAVSTALAMSRARRRRHDRLDGPLAFRLPLPAPTGEPPPPVVQLLHRAHLAATHPTASGDDEADSDEVDDPDADADSDPTPPTRVSETGPRTPARPVVSIHPAVPTRPLSADPVVADSVGAKGTAYDRSGPSAPDVQDTVLAVGTLHGRPVLLRPDAVGGLGLTGPGSDGVARAVLTALLTAAGGAAGRTRVLVPIADLDRLLGRDAVPPGVPGLTPVANLDAALDRLETHALAVVRARAGQARPTPNSEDRTVLVATPTPHAAHRLQAILATPAGVAAVLLDAWPAGLTCHLAPDATITAVYPATHPVTATGKREVRAAGEDEDALPAPVVLPDHAPDAAGARLFHLTSADALDILQLLTDHPTERPRPNPPPQSPPGPRLPQPLPGSTQGTGPVPTTAHAAPLPADVGTESGTAPAATRPDGPAETPPQVGRGLRSPIAVTTGPRWTAPVQIDLLGPPRLSVNGNETGRGARAKSFELLALLALHPDGAPGETIGDALWPDADTETARASLHGTLKRLRATLRGHTGARDAMFVVNASHRYRLDPRLVGSDVWEFQAACQLAENETETDRQLHAMREAAGLYRGALLDGAGYAWAEPARAGLHRLALQVLVRLTATLETGDPEAALATLERALALDPHNETLYQRAMRLQATLGRPEAIPATLDLLRRHLADLDVGPGPETVALAETLQHQTHRRASA